MEGRVLLTSASSPVAREGEETADRFFGHGVTPILSRTTLRMRSIPWTDDGRAQYSWPDDGRYPVYSSLLKTGFATKK